jgi:hypothetical protein
MKKLVALILTATALLAMGAQDSVVVRISWRVLPFALLSLDGQEWGESAVAATPLPAPTPTDFQRGYLSLPQAVTLRVISNTRWTVFVQALSPSLGTSYDGTFNWEISALEVGIGGDFLPLSLVPQPLVSGANGSHVLPVDYRVRLPEKALPPGDYQAVVLYTITTD